MTPELGVSKARAEALEARGGVLEARERFHLIARADRDLRTKIGSGSAEALAGAHAHAHARERALPRFQTHLAPYAGRVYGGSARSKSSASARFQRFHDGRTGE